MKYESIERLIPTDVTFRACSREITLTYESQEIKYTLTIGLSCAQTSQHTHKTLINDK